MLGKNVNRQQKSKDLMGSSKYVYKYSKNL